MFNLDLITLPLLEQLNSETEGRKYLTPTGEKYPSVTTVLSQTADKSGLDAWRKRVGAEEANRIGKRASTRGTYIHSMCEKYVLNEKIDLRREMPNNVHMFKQLKNFLDDDVQNVRLVEGRLFSHNLKVAGSVDLIAEYQGKKAVIDFKTSVKLKREDWIEDYFLQCAMYSFMFYEITSCAHLTMVVAIAVEEEDRAQIFVRNAQDYIDAAQNRCKRYHGIYG